MTTETNKPATAPKTPQIQPEAAIPDTAQDTPKTQTDTPYLTTDQRMGELEGLWTEPYPRTADTGIDMDSVYGTDITRDIDTETNVDTDAPRIDMPDAQLTTPRQMKPQTKEQIISEIAPKIQTPGITPGKATIAAEQMYAKAKERFGDDVDAVLEAYQPGQDPKKFLDGFQNAYLSGKMGDIAALENSTAAAYLTEEQREMAYALGEQVGQGLEKSRNDVRIMETSRFNTKGDPMREVTGPGVNSHPAEIQQMRSEMEGYGVEIVPRGSGMAYSPGILPGSPGQLIIEEDASYSAWMHEYKHFCDIRDAGFPGMRIFMDTEKCIKMEIDAYSIEISMAESMNRPDIAERLRELMENEVNRFEKSSDYR